MTVTNFPNGQTLTSSALTEKQMTTIFQALTCEMLGLAVNDPARNTAVRVSWQTEGAPAWTVGDDVISLQCTEVDDDYNRVRDESFSPNDLTTLKTTITYTRVWRIEFVSRGPNAFDRIRLIKSALFLDFSHDTLEKSNVYLITNIPSSRRSPELFEGRWWEITSLSIQVNEFVTETTTVNFVASTEIVVENSSGVVLDITVE